MGSEIGVQPKSVFRWLWLGFVALSIAAYLVLANVVWDSGGSRALRTALALAGLIVAPVGVVIVARSMRTLLRSPRETDFGGLGLPAPPPSSFGYRGEIVLRLVLGVGFLVFGAVRAAAPKLAAARGDVRGNAGCWELFGLGFATAGAAALAATLIKIRRGPDS